ncbi:MAG: hypothetical protein Q4E01_06260 [Actinomycetaceae bacterium]|nr:hypothetical protein [Actinomycetaceae bacterium]
MNLPSRLRTGQRTVIAALKPRKEALVEGKIVAITYPSEEGVLQLRAHLKDHTGTLIVAWPGRRDIPGVRVGARLIVEGTLSQSEHLMWSPHYQVLATEEI